MWDEEFATEKNKFVAAKIFGLLLKIF